MSDEIELYYWPTPNGRKISIALEEMGLAYTTRFVDIGKGDQFEPDFLKISPNNRMPAIVDPNGPGGEPVSVFESGAILQYLARKTGRFQGDTERARIEVDEWLFWQIGGVGPMAGQAHHFIRYAPEQIAYARKRYVDEVARLYGVLDKRLDGRDFLAGDYSIADMAVYPWARGWERQDQDIDRFPRMAAWLDRIGARPAVQRGWAVGETRSFNYSSDEEARKILFGQASQ